MPTRQKTKFGAHDSSPVPFSNNGLAQVMLNRGPRHSDGGPSRRLPRVLLGSRWLVSLTFRREAGSAPGSAAAERCRAFSSGSRIVPHQCALPRRPKYSAFPDEQKMPDATL
jgi:hypothetical protein